MKPARELVPKLCAAALMALAVWLMATGESYGAEEWKRLGFGDFPRYVQALEFSDGQVLDMSRSVTFGAWTVSFGSQRPVAEFYDRPRPGEAHQLIKIAPVDCRSPIGKRDCYIMLDQKSPPGKGCALVLDVGSGTWRGAYMGVCETLRLE